jgi:hypothetical protein
MKNNTDENFQRFQHQQQYQKYNNQISNDQQGYYTGQEYNNQNLLAYNYLNSQLYQQSINQLNQSNGSVNVNGSQGQIQIQSQSQNPQNVLIHQQQPYNMQNINGLPNYTNSYNQNINRSKGKFNQKNNIELFDQNSLISKNKLARSSNSENHCDFINLPNFNQNINNINIDNQVNSDQDQHYLINEEEESRGENQTDQGAAEVQKNLYPIEKFQNKNPVPSEKSISNSENQTSENNINYNSSSSSQRGTEIFIGNLSIDTEENDLRNEFKEFGDILDIRIHKSQNKKCYAFVRFLTKEQAKSALSKNGEILNFRQIKVTKSNDNTTIFIGNIRKNWSKSDIEVKVRRIVN